MRIAGHDIGVCSWSLRMGDAPSLIEALRSVGLEHVQLDLGPYIADSARRRGDADLYRQSGITITAGMIGFAGENYSSIATIHETGGVLSNNLWPARRQAALDAGAAAADMGIGRISTHIGFVPLSSDGRYDTVMLRVREIAVAWAEHGIDLLLETGQERAAALLQFLNDLACRNVAVNFDPANMILYGAGDPFDGIRTLGRHIRHMHVKDAKLSDQPGVRWGEEVPFGAGAVKPADLLAALHAVGYAGPLVIEREAGSDRVGDVRRAVEALAAGQG